MNTPASFDRDLPASASNRTPFYGAMHAARYQRQAAIRTINQYSNSSLICYVSGRDALIDREDVASFVDLLHNILDGTPTDLLLHTNGGDVDAAEKLITMLRTRVGTSNLLRIIVPDYAKSAGTLMVLGADRVVMSDSSELGPIDPQVVQSSPNGHRLQYSVQSYLDAYDDLLNKLQVDPNDVASTLLLNKMEPSLVQQFRDVKQRAKTFAETLLQNGMFRLSKRNFTRTAGALVEAKNWRTHSKPILQAEAIGEPLGLSVEYMHPQSAEWQRYWSLYCMQRLALKDRTKLFESDYVSIAIDSPLD